MNRITDILITDLRHLVRDLGRDGGLMSPSIYDTAQVLRLAPPAEGVWPALEWLLAQQQPDGGWGNPAVPRARDVPTLAAVLAIHTHDLRRRSRAAIERALTFLHRQAEHWAGPLPDDLPVGVELLLPTLLDEAKAAELNVPVDQYAGIIALGRKRRRMIASLTLRPGTTPVHSWEALGLPPDPTLLDATGGMGHSPAATAAWLQTTTGRIDLAMEREAAQVYLAGATRATGVGIPGVVPTAWPITRFEQSNALYALLVGGLLAHPALEDVVQPQIAAIAQAMRTDGIGFSDMFVSDGDDSLEALAVLRAAGRPASLATLTHYADGDHFCAYPGELQPSVSVTAHGIHALTLLGVTNDQPQNYLVERQLPDGRWAGDKWNGSWLYTTCQVMIALQHSQQTFALARAAEALVSFQHIDGGWGVNGSSPEETAYAVLALRGCQNRPEVSHRTTNALTRAEHWLLSRYQPFAISHNYCWLAKENYRPERLARMIELAGTFPLHKHANMTHPGDTDA
jgi:hypothetical protein